MSEYLCFIADCSDCGWQEEFESRSDAKEAAVIHAEATNHNWQIIGQRSDFDVLESSTEAK